MIPKVVYNTHLEFLEVHLWIKTKSLIHKIQTFSLSDPPLGQGGRVRENLATCSTFGAKVCQRKFVLWKFLPFKNLSLNLLAPIPPETLNLQQTLAFGSKQNS